MTMIRWWAAVANYSWQADMAESWALMVRCLREQWLKENEMAYAAISALLSGGEIPDRRSPEEKATAVVYELGCQGIDICARLEPILKDILIAAFTSEARVMELEAELEDRRIEALSGDIRNERTATE